ncbi:MAG: DUF1294 domain-containing protein [Firmicutes bacterium]|nr:DUF1294 domain-containing protein [Bacillota bacterium]
MVIALVFWNFVTFCMMGFDKRRAKNGGWRIPEKRLFLCSFLFGGPGVALGMSTFRHKTQHASFRILVPLSIFVDLAVVVALIWFVKFR